MSACSRYAFSEKILGLCLHLLVRFLGSVDYISVKNAVDKCLHGAQLIMQVLLAQTEDL